MWLNPQQTHYESIHDEFVAHYHDAPSQQYRSRFVLDPLFGGLDLNGGHVLDLACGAGVTSAEMLARFPDANLTGLDISRKACDDYARRYGRAIHADLTKPLLLDRSFDAAVIIGGLHHCITGLPTTLDNLAKALRPGGVLLMFEPNLDFLFESVRQWWYRKDRFFHADTEGALDPAELLQLTGNRFTGEFVNFLGGPAYYFIYNSLITRVPLKTKAMMAPTLFALESMYNHLPFRWPFPAFIARWQRTAVG